RLLSCNTEAVPSTCMTSVGSNAASPGTAQHVRQTRAQVFRVGIDLYVGRLILGSSALFYVGPLAAAITARTNNCFAARLCCIEGTNGESAGKGGASSTGAA